VAGAVGLAGPERAEEGGRGKRYVPLDARLDGLRRRKGAAKARRAGRAAAACTEEGGARAGAAARARREVHARAFALVRPASPCWLALGDVPAARG
jgi:hypothetical protein